MKCLHEYGQHPSFGMSFEERAIMISALETFCINFPQDSKAARMLHFVKQIDEAYRIMAHIADRKRNLDISNN